MKDQLQSEKILSIFPNPNTGYFTIPIPKEANTTNWNLEIYDISGKQVFVQQFAGNTSYIPVQQSLQTGMYFIKLFYYKNDEIMVYTGKVNIAH
jgi:hypothetical protein